MLRDFDGTPLPLFKPDALGQLIERLAAEAHTEIAAQFKQARIETRERFNSLARSNGQRFRHARKLTRK